MISRRRAGTVTAALLLAVSASAQPTAPGVLLDPLGDLIWPSVTEPDGIAFSGQAGQEYLELRIALADPWAGPAAGLVEIDADRDPETGAVSHIGLLCPAPTGLGVAGRSSAASPAQVRGGPAAGTLRHRVPPPCRERARETHDILMPVMATVTAPHRFSVRDFHRMGEAGILGEDDRVELIEGSTDAVRTTGRHPRNAAARLDAMDPGRFYPRRVTGGSVTLRRLS